MDSLEQAFDATVQVMSGGFIGYNNGQVTQGYTTRAVNEGVGEITGRNLQRGALNEQRDQIAKARAEQDKLQMDEKIRKQREDLNSSNMAGTIRERALNRARTSLSNNMGGNFSFLGSV